MKLYGTPPTRAIRAMWLLNELAIPCEIVTVDLPHGEHLSPEFLAINPAGKVPVLVDGDTVVTESAAIALYLAEKHPEAGLIPDGLADRARMYRWLFFVVTEIEQPLWRIALHTFLYPEDQRVAADVPLATADCLRMIGVFERYMAERQASGQPYVVTDRPTVADFIAAYTLDWAGEAGMLVDAPTLRAFVERMYQRPTAPPTIKSAFAALQDA